MKKLVKRLSYFTKDGFVYEYDHDSQTLMGVQRSERKAVFIQQEEAAHIVKTKLQNAAEANKAMFLETLKKVVNSGYCNSDLSEQQNIIMELHQAVKLFAKLTKDINPHFVEEKAPQLPQLLKRMEEQHFNAIQKIIRSHEKGLPVLP